MKLRPVDDLISVDDPAWPTIRDLAAECAGARIIEGDPVRCREVLFALQVSARSFLGAMALNCGGIVADHGWFRLLGGAGPDLPDLATANHLADPNTTTGPPPALVVGFDALGGRFAIDGGGLGVSSGEVCYFGPDSLEWSGLGGGHAAFVTAVLGGDLSETFRSLRWSGWQEEVAALAPSQGLSLYPPPFTAEGQDIAAVSRRRVPIAELTTFYDDASRQLRHQLGG